MMIDFSAIQFPRNDLAVNVTLSKMEGGRKEHLVSFHCPPGHGACHLWPAGIGPAYPKGDHFIVEIRQPQPEANLDEPYDDDSADGYVVIEAAGATQTVITETGTTGVVITDTTEYLRSIFADPTGVMNTGILDVGAEGRP